MRCAFLTMDDLTGYVTDDELAVPLLRARGWNVDLVPWRSVREWSDFDVVVVRSTWDYQKTPAEFVERLAQIDRQTRLANPLELMRWNMDKRYLRTLAEQGIPIPPTRWRTGLEWIDVDAAFRAFDCDELVVKPVVSANADDTWRIPRHAALELVTGIAPSFAGRALMLQPFLESIPREGEVSVVLFGDDVSHALRKTPKAGDFRVQEEHGGLIAPEPVDAALADAARTIVARLPQRPLYARADFASDGQGAPLLMELELIEPSLYLRMDEAAPDRFAAAIDARFGRASRAQSGSLISGCSG